jgi:thermostable 8-oxoguanine DNA glycosylase
MSAQVAPFRSITCEHPAVRADWQFIWPAFEQAYAELAPADAVATEPGLRRELLFCLLGGHGVTFETSRSAAQAVDELDVFADDHDAASLHASIVATLESPRFEPIRKDGTLRRYRFPRRKATLICQARAWLHESGSLAEQLAMRTCERERRTWLVTCPGLGPKSASWLLRNTGWASELAILDIHVMRAMTDAGLLQEPRLSGGYERVEALFLDWCSELDAAPAVFDLFLWEWQRGTLRAGRAEPVL